MIANRTRGGEGAERGGVHCAHWAADRKSPRQPPSVLFTPDGRYIVVRGRLWRAANPKLRARRREELVLELMQARRDVAQGLRRKDAEAVADARSRVRAAKVALGERGPVWWSDGAPDLTRCLIKNTPYGAWHAALNTRPGPGKKR